MCIGWVIAWRRRWPVSGEIRRCSPVSGGHDLEKGQEFSGRQDECVRVPEEDRSPQTDPLSEELIDPVEVCPQLVR